MKLTRKNLTQTEIALQRTTQAIKDILNAAGKGQPYTVKELQEIFTRDYFCGNLALQAAGLEEIA